jgi:anti-sigma B factor antagonist
MPADHTILQTHELGELTVVGFGGRAILDDIDPAACRAEAAALVHEQKCKILAFDLSGVPFIPSGLLGMMVSLRRLNIEVHLYNPCPDIREVLDVTHLDKILPMHDVDLKRSCC